MTSPTRPHRPSHPAHRRVARAVAGLTVAGVLLATAACSSGDDTAATRPSGAGASPAPTATPVAVEEDHALVLRDILEAHHAAGEFVGARIALLDADGTVTESSAGTATLDAASGPVDADAAWNVGSATKTFVAVVALQLAEEGAIDLDAGIGRFLPGLPGADRITPRQLLQHTSGLGEYIDQPAVVDDEQRAWTPAELIAVAEAAGRVGEPGGEHRYSNTNYIVLGEIVEQVTGNPWAHEVRTRIAEPLGMTRTREITDDRPVGYGLADGAFVETTSGRHPSVGGAAGALQSTNRDLLRFAEALADGTLLSPASRAAMETFVPGEDLSQFGIVHGYGLGLEQYANDAVTVTGHMGTGTAQSAYVGYDTARGAAVAVMTNTAVPGPAAIMAVETLIGLTRTR